MPGSSPGEGESPGSGQPRAKPRGIFLPTALLVIVVAAIASLSSGLLIGMGPCGDGPDGVSGNGPGPAAYVVCEIEFPKDKYEFRATPRGFHIVRVHAFLKLEREFLALLLPLLIVLAGVVMSRRRRQDRPFYIALLAATVALFAPWIVLIALWRR